MKIGMLGMGKLGLPVAFALASKGHEVYGYDASSAPYEYVAACSTPYVEENLTPLMSLYRVNMVAFPESLFNCDIIFVAVQTPHGPEYEGVTRIPPLRADFDYTFLKHALNALEDYDGIIAVISTCLPGTFTRELSLCIPENASYAYTPQFIAMGTVLQDYLHPEFNLIGHEPKDKLAAMILEDLYKEINGAPTVITDITTAEGIKIMYNTALSMKIVLANFWGELAHKAGMNFDDLRKAWSLSTRRLHSPRYTDSGVGDGGGCHPRDLIALSYISEDLDMSFNLSESLMLARERHMEFLAEEALRYADIIDEAPRVTVLGRSFKPETLIETGSASVLLANLLTEKGAVVNHIEDAKFSELAQVIVIGTKHSRYVTYDFPFGCVVIDPFRYIPFSDNYTVIHIGGINAR